MNTKLSAVVRSTMKEEKLCSLTIKNGAKLNLLVVGSDFLPFPVYVVRCNRREFFKTTEKSDALVYFRNQVIVMSSDLNELF